MFDSLEHKSSGAARGGLVVMVGWRWRGGGLCGWFYLL